jgi:hypothetical protein
VSVLQLIPDGATVAASNQLAPWLVARCTVYLFPDLPDHTVAPEWIVDTDPPDGTVVPAGRTAAATRQLPGLGYREVAHRDGVVYHRG